MAKNISTLLKALPAERQTRIEARAARLATMKGIGIHPSRLPENPVRLAQRLMAEPQKISVFHMPRRT